MLLRATVVLLVILNVGVAVWWGVRGEAGAASAQAATGPSTLQLVSESAAAQAATSESAQAERIASGALPALDEGSVADAPPRAAEPPQCVALGPFADAATRDAALAQLAPGAVQISPRDAGETPRGWRVWMAPLPGRDAADAMVARLLAAGFNDYYVIADGADINGIALGRFGSEAAARARARALRDAGFEVDAGPLGGALTRHWIDVTLAEGDTGDALRARVDAARVETRDCNTQRVAG